MTAVRSAIVVGAGIAGLVCARALALVGVAVTLLERRPEVTDEGGIGIGIQSNAMEALGRIGLAQRCIENGVPVEMIYIHAPTGAQIAAQPSTRHAGSHWPGYVGMRRSALHAVLVDGAREAGVRVVTQASVDSIDQDDRSVTVRTADGQIYTADLLVAADGIYSRIRGALFPDHASAVPTGEGVWRALIEGERRNDARLLYGGRVGTIGYVALPEDTYLYVVDDVTKAPARDDPDLAERLVELIGHYPGFPSELLASLSRKPGDVTYRALETASLPDPWYVARAILIGDAAHAGPPTLAQGAAMGIEDGVVLAETLANASDLSSALAAFMHRRYRRVRTIVDASITISRAQMEPDGRARMVEAQQAAAAALAVPI